MRRFSAPLADLVVWAKVFILLSVCLQPAAIADNPANRRQTFQTNQVTVYDPPAWLTESRIDKVVGNIQNFLEWDIRRVPVYWYTDQDRFQSVHGLGPKPVAVTKRNDKSIHMGPKVDSKNFDSIFGHELAHVIVLQKYQKAIPDWLDEGLANYAARHGTVDYKYLATQPARDVTRLSHPFMANADDRYHYQASTALMEMFASKCSISDLLQLSVGKKLETYLKTYCEISDLNGEFSRWILANAQGKPGAKKKYWWQNRKASGNNS